MLEPLQGAAPAEKHTRARTREHINMKQYTCIAARACVTCLVWLMRSPCHKSSLPRTARNKMDWTAPTHSRTRQLDNCTSSHHQDSSCCHSHKHCLLFVLPHLCRQLRNCQALPAAASPSQLGSTQPHHRTLVDSTWTSLAHKSTPRHTGCHTRRTGQKLRTTCQLDTTTAPHTSHKSTA